MTKLANPLLDRMVGGLDWSARQGAVLLAAGIFGGVLVPPLARAFQWFITPNVFCMMTLVLLRVDLPGTVAHLRRPGRVAAMVAVQLVLSPVAVWLAVVRLGLDPAVAGGAVVFATGCAATSSPAFARMVGLDPELALIVALLTTALVPLTAPPIALGLVGVELPIGIGALMLRLLVIVGLPTLLSLALRRAAGPVRLARYGAAVDGLLVWLVVFYGFAVTQGFWTQVAADPGWVVQALLVGFAADFGLNLLVTGLFAPLGRRTAATAGFMGGNRNMALYLAVMPVGTDPKLLLFFGLCQFPLFLSPFLLRPVYRRLGLMP